MVWKWICLLVLFTLVTAAYNEEYETPSEAEEIEEYDEGDRFKRQAEETNGTDDGPPPPRPVHPKMRKCCKKMPQVIPHRMMRGCKRPPPEGGPGGPPGEGPGGPPGGGPGGPPGEGPDGPPGEGPDGPPGEGPDGPPGDDEDIDGTGDDAGESGTDDEGPTDGTGPGTNTTAPEKFKEGERVRGKHGRCKGGHGKDWRDGFACAMECAFNKSGLLKDGAVDQDAFAADMEKMKEEKNGEVWKDAIDLAVKNCSATVPSTVNQNQKCKSGAVEMAICMDNMLFMNCPDSNWRSDKEKCKACRESPENCAPPRKERKKKKDEEASP